jgi:DnaJ-like protein
MNYYEELGLTPAATAAEIRQAYKHLARLLHPDRQQAPALRQVAECQMQRLNMVMAVLGDAGRRLEYDAGLTGTRTRPPADATGGWRNPRLRLIAAASGLAAALLLARLWPDRKPAHTAAAYRITADRPLPASQTVVPFTDSAERISTQRELTALRAQVRDLRIARDRALAELADLPAGIAPLPDRGVTAVAVVPASPFAGPALESATAVERPSPTRDDTEAAPAEMRNRFSGTWFYAPRPAMGAGPRYPPEYIEAVIQEVGGTLRGRYRALYRVPDRAISPEVKFQFAGRAGPDTANLEWNNADGAYGRIEIYLLSENSMEVKWTATELGKSLELVSGSAVLIRRRGP